MSSQRLVELFVAAVLIILHNERREFPARLLLIKSAHSFSEFSVLINSLNRKEFTNGRRFRLEVNVF
jgi:hypothetical protein